MFLGTHVIRRSVCLVTHISVWRPDYRECIFVRGVNAHVWVLEIIPCFLCIAFPLARRPPNHGDTCSFLSRSPTTDTRSRDQNRVITRPIFPHVCNPEALHCLGASFLTASVFSQAYGILHESLFFALSGVVSVTLTLSWSC